MGTSGDPVQSSYAYGSQGEPIAMGTSFGDTQLPQLTNPGSLDPSGTNPYAAQFLKNNQTMGNMFYNSAAGGAFNPAFYDNMKNTQQENITSSMGNQYARMGLAGSSAEMGGLNNAIQQNQMSWLSRQQSDQMRALQGMESINQQGYQQTMGIQNQYGNFQDVMGQDYLSLLGIQQGQRAGNQQFLGGIIGGGMQGAGSAYGGSQMAAALAV